MVKKPSGMVWVRSAASSRYMAASEELIAIISKSERKWHWNVIDWTGRRIADGACVELEAAKDKATQEMAARSRADALLRRLERDRYDAGFSRDEWV
jgi:hypothetical protein